MRAEARSERLSLSRDFRAERNKTASDRSANKKRVRIPHPPKIHNRFRGAGALSSSRFGTKRSHSGKYSKSQEKLEIP